MAILEAKKGSSTLTLLTNSYKVKSKGVKATVVWKNLSFHQ